MTFVARAEVKERIRSAQYEALKVVNKEMIEIYWDIGKLIVERQNREGWGKSVVERLANDLQNEFPGVGGFSTSNLWRMKGFCESYTDSPKLAPLVREIGWSHNIVIMERSKDPLEREFYIRMTRKFGWSKNVLIHQIENQSYEKTLLGQTNFDKTLTLGQYGSSGIVGTQEKALVTGPAIIVGRKGNVGSIYWSKDDFHPIVTVYFIETEHFTTYLYYALLHTQFINTDVAVPGFNRDLAHSLTLLIPDDTIFALFEQDVAVIHDQIDKLTKYNKALTQARYFLLPRLMNGEVAV